jgi:hypothetical protein
MLKAYLEYSLYVGIMMAVILGSLMFAVVRCRRICRGHRWANVAAAAVGLFYLGLLLIPFAFYGAEWSMFWPYLTMPLFPFLEYLQPLGYNVYILLASCICALMWGTLSYIFFALFISIRRRSAAK